MPFFRTLSEPACRAIITRILRDFGEGMLPEGAYVFDAITRLPKGCSEVRTAWGEILPEIRQHAQICIVFDPHPNNAPYREDLLRSVNAEDAPGLVASPEDVARLLAATHCDFYITTLDGELLAVACHEDEFDGAERVLWRPVQSG